MSNPTPNCAVEPSPLYSSTTYTLYSPGQSEVPPDFSPGWETTYPAEQVAWEPNPCAPECLQDIGIESLNDWIDWFYCQIIKLFCDWANSSCKMMVGGKLFPIDEVLASCLSMNTINNTIVYDEKNNVAVAGRIIGEGDCAVWMKAATVCIPDAPAGSPTPLHVLGRIKGDSDNPYKFTVTTQPLARLRQQFTAGNAENVIETGFTGVRYVPLANIDTQISPNEGCSYSNSTGKLTIGRKGFYRFGCHTFVDIKALFLKAGAAARINICAGFVIEQPVTYAMSEIRTFQNIYYREHILIQRVMVKWHQSMFLEQGVKITPRIWMSFDETDSVPIALDMSNFTNLGQITLFRIADKILA